VRQFNFYGFITLYGIIFLTILFKVFHVPVTTDEVPAAFFYSTFSFWEIMMFPDNWPNNHILNTMLAKCCIMLFGKEQWVIRLPNLLIFILYGFGVYRILKLVLKRDSWYFLPASLLFVNPYLLDFFGLCRGYGISTTMVILTVVLILTGYIRKKPAWIWLSLFTSILASYANFTVLVFWAATVIMVWFYFVLETKGRLKKLAKPTLIIFFISIAYLALILVPILKMQNTDQFKYWTSRGFYDDTIISLIHEWRYNSKILSAIHSNYIVAFIVTILLINIISIILYLRKEKFSIHFFRQPAFIATMLLLLPVFINILQTLILDTPNLKGRTALFFYPLFATVTIVAIGALPKFKKNWLIKTLAIITIVIFVANLSHRLSLKSVREWSYDQNTLQVTEYLKEKHNGTLVSLKTNWIFHPSFYFYADAGKIPWIDLQYYDYNLDINTRAEYYYVFAKDYKFLEPRFEVECKFSDDRWLLKQKNY
jgi:hypothetical protein